MMKKVSLLAFAAIMMMMVSCGPSHEKQVTRIQTMEKSLFSPDAVSFNKEKADSLVSFYTSFIKDFPKDSLSPGFLFKAANIEMNSTNSKKALELFDQYRKDYPDMPKASLCLFFKAFIYENHMQDIEKARETYLLFIETYPNDEFAKDAKMALANLGKTPEMIIREFESRQKADSARVADSIVKSGKTRKSK